MKFFIRIGFGIIGPLAKYAPFLIYPLYLKSKIILKYVIRYRKKAITKNLKKSFGKSVSINEIKNLRSRYYDVLVRYLKEVLYTYSWAEKKLLEKLKFENIDTWKAYFSAQKSTIVLASHYGNWEMNMVLFPKFVDQRVIAFYKPISNDNIDDFLLNKRSRFGLELHPIEQTVRVMTKLKNENILYIFIGDQSPLNMNGVYWNIFLNQETPWLTGAEKLSIKFDYPVVYLSQTPHKANKSDPYFYSLAITKISNEKTLNKPISITEVYSRILESEIMKKPEYWLWSHKRWKRANLFPEIE